MGEKLLEGLREDASGTLAEAPRVLEGDCVAGKLALSDAECAS
jgi:hypothetical protein